MGRLEARLNREAKGFSVLGWAVLCLVLQKIYVPLFTYLISFFVEISSHNNETFRKIFELPLPLLFCTLVPMAFFEEIIYRFPISWIVKTSDKRLSSVIFASVILSLVFGLAHGHFLNILIQGVCGFMWSILYLKCGGFEGKILKPLIVTTLVHATYNFSLVFHI